jgi:NAD-dependent deacetylase
MKKKIVVLSGAGISAESGIQTFRDGDGLWENHDIHDVATPEAFERNPELVLRFYNERRKNITNVEPNAAHTELVRLEDQFDVAIVTQNIDDLHERAGSSNVCHLHGEIFKMCSAINKELTFPIQGDISLGELSPDGHQLRPFIVWFGEAVPMMDKAIALCQQADILIIVGTSLQVYPAAGLVNYVRKEIPIYLIDKNLPNVASQNHIESYTEKATIGVKRVVDLLMNKV